MFTYHTEVQLHHTDAAGVLFFSHQFTLAHDAYQAFLKDIGLPLSYFVGNASYYLPIVHAEGDYRLPLEVGESITITVTVSRIGRTSFALHYELSGETGGHCGSVDTVHVSLDRKSRQKISLPAELKEKLMAYHTPAD